MELTVYYHRQCHPVILPLNPPSPARLSWERGKMFLYFGCSMLAGELHPAI